MNKKNTKKKITDAEIEELFKKHSGETNINHGLHSEKRSLAVKKIVKRARTESSAKTISEFTFVSFWTGVLEFISLFCTFLDQKSVNKDKPKND